MEEKKQGKWILLGILVFIVYLFIAAKPVGTEIVLEPAWLQPLQPTPLPEVPVAASPASDRFPFVIGGQFGYFTSGGTILFSKPVQERLSISDEAFCEYPAVPAVLEFRNPEGQVTATSTERGYPWFASGRSFLLAPEQNALSELNKDGSLKWKRDFSSPITCADAKGDLVLAGLLDGSVELLDSKGERRFQFSPGASRYELILAAKLSSDGSMMAIISGVSPQRFLVLARTADTYKVIWHEYLDEGFRRPVQALFTNDDRWILYERDGMLGVFDTKKRESATVAIGTEITCLDSSSGGDLLFLIAGEERNRELITIALPDRIIQKAPFRGGYNFIRREGDNLFLASDKALLALKITTR